MVRTASAQWWGKLLLRVLPLPCLLGAMLLTVDLQLLYTEPRGSFFTDGEVLTRSSSQPFPWETQFSNLDRRLTATPGGTWNLDFQAEVDLSRYTSRYGRFKEIIVAVSGDWVHDRDGFFRPGPATYAVSANFTTAGIPLERFDGWPMLRLLHGKGGSPFEAIRRFPLEQGTTARVHDLSGTLTVKLPPDMPVGHYEPRFHVLVAIDGVAEPVHLGQFAYEVEKFPRHPLPLVKVGAAAPPRLPMTLFQDVQVAGQTGLLPEEDRGKTALVHRSGFEAPLVLPPGKYRIRPGLPSIFPRAAVAPIAGSFENLTRRMDHFLMFKTLTLSASIKGPAGERKLGTRRFQYEGDSSIVLSQGGLDADLSTHGTYTVRLAGHVSDIYQRKFKLGGEYKVEIARRLTFSTSCKPGTSFLVGDRYPPKVNVNPPVPAHVTFTVDYYPGSSKANHIRWEAAGRANRYGHYVTRDKPPLLFDQPGEYHSTVTARWTDGRGNHWKGVQTSTGVIAPRRDEERTIVMHGTKSFPWRFMGLGGEKGTFRDRPNYVYSPFLQQPYAVQDPFAPYEASTTLFMPAVASTENSVQPRFSMRVKDPSLARRLSQAHARKSVMLLGWMQPREGPIKFLRDVIELSTDSFAYFPLEGGMRQDHLPIMPIGGDGWHGLAFPQKNTLDAYALVGIFRPGFPVLTSAFQNVPKGFYWIGNPNPFGNHYAAGLNGDLEGDLYRMSAGVVVKDSKTGKNHYDAYASTVVFTSFDEAHDSVSMLPPGERPIYSLGPEPLRILLAADTHDTLEVGENLVFGGVILPVLPANVTWTVTLPSGAVNVQKSRANRLGVVRSREPIPVAEPGLYRVHVAVQHGQLKGDLPGLANSTYWHCAVPRDKETLLRSALSPVTQVDALQGVRIPLAWPADLEKVRLHYGVIMPGQVLTQGELAPSGNSWEYPFYPAQLAAQFPNFDARYFGDGTWLSGETVVFQFFLEAERRGEKVFDSLRLFLRRERLFNPPPLGAKPPANHGHGHKPTMHPPGKGPS